MSEEIGRHRNHGDDEHGNEPDVEAHRHRI
jgi:hypothetical protein